MDQGLAAVLGATVGVVGTLGTACLTYLTARHQARDQGRVAHAQTVRDERRATYLEVLTAGEILASECAKSWKWITETEPNRVISDILKAHTQLEAAMRNLEKAANRVKLAGPVDAIHRMDLLLMAAGREMWAVRDRLESGGGGMPHSNEYLESKAERAEETRQLVIWARTELDKVPH
ncbi:hypothetical protein [Streptomyces sp. 6N106]|uniref:hypothetical protein n=1 Tax=Streptomyces sp. 6N106 TaxID=3457418 RepID=UPI003FD0822C